jgi:hypothetical protein
MEMLEKLSVTRLLIEELSMTVDRLLAICKKILEDPYLTAVIEEIEKDNSLLQKIVIHDRKSPYTISLREKDHFRGQMYLGLLEYASGLSRNKLEKKANAGHLILDIINARGTNIKNLSYKKESILIESVLAEFDTPKATKAIAIINAETLVEDLRQAQIEFEEIYVKKAETETTETLPTISSLKKEINPKLYALLYYVFMNSKFKPEIFGPILEQVNEIIEDTMTIVKSRHTRKKHDKDKIEAEKEESKDLPIEE